VPGHFCSPHPATASSMVTFPHATAIIMEQALAKLGTEGLDRFLTAVMADLDTMLYFANGISFQSSKCKITSQTWTRAAPSFDEFSAVPYRPAVIF